MNNIEEIYNTLKEEVAHNLAGELLINDGTSIRWQLDGIVHGHSQNDLEELAQDDIDLINEILEEYSYNELIEIRAPEFDDIFVFFYIEEL